MFIEEIEVRNLPQCKTFHLEFKRDLKNVIIAQTSEENCPVRSYLTFAIELILSERYSTIESLSDLGQFHNLWVRLCLVLPKSISSSEVEYESEPLEEISNSDSDEPCTSQQALHRQNLRMERKKKQKLREQMKNFTYIKAIRDMKNDPNRIKYIINNGRIRKCSVSVFLNKYNFCLQTETIQWNEPSRNIGNIGWIKLLSSQLNDFWVNEKNFPGLFDNFVKLYIQDDNINNCNILSKLTTSCLQAQIALNVIEKAEILLIFGEIRRIFEYITCLEYTVWFLFPYNDNFVDIVELKTEQINFEKLRTYIQLKSDRNRPQYSWNEIVHPLNDLLMVAFQLVLTHYSKQKIVFLKKLDYITEYQCFEMATLAIIQSEHQIGIPWKSKNYLQRLIEVCIYWGMSSIMEYPSAIPLKPQNAHLIRYIKTDDLWDVELVEQKINPMEHVVEVLKNIINTK